jgi:SAM-dependent methyltransferase
MNSPEVDQIAALNRIFSEIYARCKPAALAVLGCATGNGFEHVDPAVTKRLVGIDINPEYLDIARERYRHLEPIFELICAPVESCDFAGGAFDLVHAGLIFEYLDPADILLKIAEWLSPAGMLSVVLQLPSEQSGAVSKTTFESVRVLGDIMRLVLPDELERMAHGAGLRLIESRTTALPRGKSFMVDLFQRDQTL